MVVRDLPPPSFLVDLPVTVFTARVSPEASERLSYRVRPPSRGDAAFGDLFVRVDGPLGLVRRAFRQTGTAQARSRLPQLARAAAL